MMYLEHFGLTRAPFKITPDTSLFFAGNQRGAALDALSYAIKSGEGIIKVVGEVGSGKTMLCRMLEVKLTDEVDVVYIANPSLSPDNILHVIAHELSLDIPPDSNKFEVMQRLQAYLLEKHTANRQVVVFVEEAQSMPIETLEEIRLLSNLETDQNKLLQMVLFGQPELDEKLAQPAIRQLKERITHSFNLEPFRQQDTLEYLNFRLRAVGYRGPDIFNERTAGIVKKYSGGLTRRINIIADKALMATFSEGKHEVTGKHIHTAAADSEFKKGWALPAWWPWLAGIVGLLILAVVVYGLYDADVIDATGVEEHTLQTEQFISGQGLLDVTSQSTELLDKRLKATEKWLQVVSDSHYSIQLFLSLTREASAVEAFLRGAPEILDFDKIYIYETMIDGNRMYSVLYNSFPSRRSAQMTLETLPASLQASKPFLRRVGALRKDLANGR